jgi:hypothetical protein
MYSKWHRGESQLHANAWLLRRLLSASQAAVALLAVEARILSTSMLSQSERQQLRTACLRGDSAGAMKALRCRSSSGGCCNAVQAHESFSQASNAMRFPWFWPPGFGPPSHSAASPLPDSRCCAGDMRWPVGAAGRG